MPRHLAVYCSSSNHVAPAFFALATEMGRLIAAHSDVLVYGGGCVGLMGAMAQAVHAGGGKVVGVIPESMRNAEVAYLAADELIWTQTMRERKAIMDERADAFVALPGGFGTLEELIEVLTHRQLRYHDKPVIIVNAQGFYDPLLALFEHFYRHHFAKDKHRQSYHVAPDAAGVYSYLDASEVVK